MGYLVKAAALFVGLRVTESYHQALKVDPTKEAGLKAAKEEIRNAIRASSPRVRAEDSFWQGPYANQRRLRSDITPKFFTQGSVAYNLLISTCHTPPQQLDLDDGMYVPVDFLENGQPALTARALFTLVEEALQPLCQRKGWTLDRSKDTCVRVQISHDSHIDIPIYSAPREIIALDEAVASLAEAIHTARLAKGAGQSYVSLPEDKIMLAHRDGTWEQSDPLKLHRWVDDCVNLYGEDFRRACRYFKGWKDFRWRKCCLTSITIMAAVDEALRQLAGTHRRLEDDQLVYEIAQRLPGILRGALFNPAFPGQRIVLNDWDDDQQSEIGSAADDLAAEMRNALTGTGNADLVIAALRRAFGSRIPHRPDVIEVVPHVAATVKAEEPATVPAPKVTKSTSG